MRFDSSLNCQASSSESIPELATSLKVGNNFCRIRASSANSVRILVLPLANFKNGERVKYRDTLNSHLNLRASTANSVRILVLMRVNFKNGESVKYRDTLNSQTAVGKYLISLLISTRVFLFLSLSSSPTPSDVVSVSDFRFLLDISLLEPGVLEQ